ncbi:hypothetical protein CHCC14814_0214 [Bacillus paralicheniformis]|nr:hypothetical protein CHCC14814_0214 [Bacillus paralicheniformis]
MKRWAVFSCFGDRIDLHIDRFDTGEKRKFFKKHGLKQKG